MWEVYNAAYTSNSLTVTGLVAGTTYKFKVAATNSIGSSAFTSEFPIVAASVPGPPTDLTIDTTLTNGTQVAFSWTAPTENGGLNVTGYRILWN